MCSAASFSDARRSSLAERARALDRQRPDRAGPGAARKTSGEAETIAQPSPASGSGWSGRSGARRCREPRRVALERRREVLDEVHLVDVAAPDRGAHGLDRVRVVRGGPASAPTSPISYAPGAGALLASRIRQAASGRRHGSGGAGRAIRRSRSEIR